MRVEIELKNYRCFPMDRPARFAIGPRLTGFIGTNNSGKSAVLRFFYEFRDLFGRLIPGGGNLNNLLGPGEALSVTGVQDQAEIFNNRNDLGMEIRFRYLDRPSTEASAPIPEHAIVAVDRSTSLCTVRFDDVGPVSAGLGWEGTVLVIDGVRIELGPWLDFFAALRNSIYVGPFRNAIQVGTGQHYDLSLGQAFVAQWDQYRSGPIKQQNDAALSMTEQIREIFGFERLDINATSDNQTLQIIIDGRSYRLDEVGAGIAHFIIVLTTAAVRQPRFLFIDEPELNLHPSLQLSFLTTVAGYARDGVLFATHNIGLARAAGAAVYSVRAMSAGRSEIHLLEGTPRLAEFLGELGLTGYQELGYDHVLLVEGPTDVAAVQQFLRLFGVSHRVVVIHLGGSALINDDSALQLEEITRLSHNISALVDSERSSENDAPPDRIAAFAKTCGDLGIGCHVLERRALENYFTERAIVEVKGDAYQALEPYEVLREHEPSWGKDENWRIASAMTKDELDTTDLGAFLERLVAGT